MKAITLGEAKEAMGAELVQGDPGVRVERVATDTRTLVGGELFFALRGARFDGHDFVRQAIAAGAAGLVVSREVAVPPDVPVLRVEDTLRALQELARVNRRRCGLPVVAVTGSTGKTTTKDLVTAVLATRLRVLATRENLNNEIGLPLTLLEIGPVHQVAVVELGMRGLGEIDVLARICQPTGGVISNVGEAHLELLGTVENIARAKGELLDHIPASGFALLHADSPALAPQVGRCRGRVTFFGEAEHARIRLLDYRAVPGGCVFRVQLWEREAEFQLPLLGRHMAVNALAAVGVGLELGLTEDDIRAGLVNARLSSLRQAVVETGRLTIINDTYNASPASVKAALDVLRDLAGGRPTVAVLGGMCELGPRAAVAHREVGRACARAGVGYLVTVGELAAGIADGARAAGLPALRIQSCDTTGDAVAAVRRLAPEGAVILVKGSRAFRMERVVDGLAEAAVDRRSSVVGSRKSETGNSSVSGSLEDDSGAGGNRA
jgi:UDP-N-acetylmuramoyl-tripeptide--D-alanyl-D-alanine ligase